MENTKTQFGDNPRGGEKAPIDPYVKGLNELRKSVEAHLGKIKGLMVNDIDIDINVYDTVFDLCSKIENLLYCEHGEYCQFPNALLWILDFSDDIKRIAGYFNYTDIYIEASKIWYTVHKFYYGW